MSERKSGLAIILERLLSDLTEEEKRALYSSLSYFIIFMTKVIARKMSR
jgi:hypothetical protein